MEHGSSVPSARREGVQEGQQQHGLRNQSSGGRAAAAFVTKGRQRRLGNNGNKGQKRTNKDKKREKKKKSHSGDGDGGDRSSSASQSEGKTNMSGGEGGDGGDVLDTETEEVAEAEAEVEAEVEASVPSPLNLRLHSPFSLCVCPSQRHCSRARLVCPPTACRCCENRPALSSLLKPNIYV